MPIEAGLYSFTPSREVHVISSLFIAGWHGYRAAYCPGPGGVGDRRLEQQHASLDSRIMAPMTTTGPRKIEVETTGLGKHYVECRRCDKGTWHSTLALARDLDEDGDTRALSDYEIIQCDGCRTMSFRSVWELGLPGAAPGISEENLYPPRRDRKARRALTGSRVLPERVRSIYSEAIRAMNNNLPVLAGIGVRALVESVCKHKRVPGANLQQRIDGLAAAGLLGSSEAKTLHRIRFLGNKAAHEMKQPTTAELSAGMDIAEHLLDTVYLLPKKARKLPSR